MVRGGVGSMADGGGGGKDKKKIFQDLSDIVAKILQSLSLKGEKAGDRGPSPLFSEFPPFPTPGPPDKQTDSQTKDTSRQNNCLHHAPCFMAMSTKHCNSNEH